MLFVGRERAMKRLTKALQTGLHPIVTGPYGIGRTTLLRRLAESTGDRWRFLFLDFDRPTAKLCRFLFSELFPHRALDAESNHVSHSGIRFRLFNWETEDPRRTVLVLDNIAAISRSKLRLIAGLASSKKYILVSIVESFLDPSTFDELRARLAPAPLIPLRHLSYGSACEYFALASEIYTLGWSRDRIGAMAKATGGYPLGMWQAVDRERQRPAGRSPERLR